MNNKILCVDDEPSVLSGYRRQLHGKFQIEIALGGAEGLDTIDQHGPFAVVMTDMRMPEMNGIEFLTAVRERAPDSVRVMLTGNADLGTAIDAVNEGCVTRFLTKPCPPEVLMKALTDGVELYRLVVSERELLNRTLTGSIKVLTDVLNLMNPAAFSCGVRVGRWVRKIATQLSLQNVWQYEMAAMLSQIGCVAVPPEVLEKARNDARLTPEEGVMYAGHPSVGRQLLENIPRLESIALMIEQQNRPFNTFADAPKQDDQNVELGSQILKAALDFDRRAGLGQAQKDILRNMRQQSGEYNPQVLDAFERLLFRVIESRLPAGSAVAQNQQPRKVELQDLRVGMIAYNDIRAKNDILLLVAGEEVTLPALVRIRNYGRTPGLAGPIFAWEGYTDEDEQNAISEELDAVA